MKLLSPKNTLLRWGSEESVKCSTSVKQSAPISSVSSEGRLFRERVLKKWNDPSSILSVFSATQFSMCSSPFFLVKLSSLNTMLSKLFRLRIRTVRMEPRENEPTERRSSLRNAPRSNTVLSMSLHSPSGITNSFMLVEIVSFKHSFSIWNVSLASRVTGSLTNANTRIRPTTTNRRVEIAMHSVLPPNRLFFWPIFWPLLGIIGSCTVWTMMGVLGFIEDSFCLRIHNTRLLHIYASRVGIVHS